MAPCAMLAEITRIDNNPPKTIKCKRDHLAEATEIQRSTTGFSAARADKYHSLRKSYLSTPAIYLVIGSSDEVVVQEPLVTLIMSDLFVTRQLEVLLFRSMYIGSAVCLARIFFPCT
jgi:hypothetical protein